MNTVHILLFVFFAIIKLANCLFESYEKTTIRSDSGRRRNRGGVRTKRYYTRQSAKRRYKHDQDRNDRWRPEIHLGKVEKGLKGKLVDDGAMPSVLFRRNGYKYRVQIKEHHRGYMVRVLCAWPDPDFRLKVEPDDHPEVLNKILFGIEDLSVGIKVFDDQFIVQSNSPHRLTEVLDRQVCNMIRSHRDIVHKRVSINIHGGQVEFGGMANVVLAHQQVIMIAKNFAEVHRLMLQGYLEDGADMDLVFVEKETSTCLVCGEQVSESKGVECRSCETRYHPDCWDYIGKCSTYGCRSRKYSR